MPLYDYDCSACGRRFEVVHGVHVEGPAVCPICGKGPIRKAISAAAVHYKGTGWAKKERHATASRGTSKASGEGLSSDGGTRRDDSGSPEGGAGSDDSASSSEGGAKRDETGSSSGTPTATATKPVETGMSSKAD